MTRTQPISPTSRLARLGNLSFQRRRVVLVAWVAALLAAALLGGLFAGDWAADYDPPGSGAKRASELVADAFPNRSTQTVDVVWRSAGGATAAPTARRMNRLLHDAAALEGIGGGVSVREARVSSDGNIGIARLQLTKPPLKIPVETGEALISLAQRAETDGLRVELGGQVIRNAEGGAISSEAIGLLIAALILLVTFGSVVAAGLPIGVALASLGISAVGIGLLAALLDVPDWAPSMAAMLGIGVGIDYALLIVTRVRAGIAAGLDVQLATVTGIATAGRSVVIAGTTVVISLMGLFLMGQTYLYGVALASILTVVIVMAANLTLLPALLGFARNRLSRWGAPAPATRPSARGPEAARWSRAVQRHPRAAAVAGVAALVLLAAPAAGMRLGFPDAGNDPAGTTSRAAYELIGQGFGPGANGPLIVAADLRGERDRASFVQLAETIARVRGVTAVQAPVVNPAGTAGLMVVQPERSPQDEATERLIDDLRDGPLAASGLEVALGGQTAGFVDQSRTTASRLPLFVSGVVGLSFLLLLITFRSLVVPLKAAALNLLAAGAAYGVVTLVADGGWAGSLVGIDSATPVPPFIPILMFAILFGLSMDYEVFLLSRVREAYLVSGDASQAMTEGLRQTARVIAAAAAIMIAVFGAFALSDDVLLKLIGTGLATAILIDAVIVRLVVVPAVMHLFGERGWWLPRWLDRLLPHAQMEPA